MRLSRRLTQLKFQIMTYRKKKTFPLEGKFFRADKAFKHVKLFWYDIYARHWMNIRMTQYMATKQTVWNSRSLLGSSLEEKELIIMEMGQGRVKWKLG